MCLLLDILRVQSHADLQNPRDPQLVLISVQSCPGLLYDITYTSVRNDQFPLSFILDLNAKKYRNIYKYLTLEYCEWPIRFFRESRDILKSKCATPQLRLSQRIWFPAWSFTAPQLLSNLLSCIAMAGFPTAQFVCGCDFTLSSLSTDVAGEKKMKSETPVLVNKWKKSVT